MTMWEEILEFLDQNVADSPWVNVPSCANVRGMSWQTWQQINVDDILFMARDLDEVKQVWALVEEIGRILRLPRQDTTVPLGIGRKDNPLEEATSEGKGTIPRLRWYRGNTMEDLR